MNNPTDNILHKLSAALQGIDTKSLAEVFRFVSFEANEPFGPHLHRRIEINYLRRGSCRMVIDAQEIAFCEGDVMVLMPDVPHSFCSGPKGCVLMQLEFLPDIFDRFSELLGDRTSQDVYDPDRVRYLKLVNNTEITSTVQAILSELSSNRQNRNLMVVMHYGILLVYLYRRLNEHVVIDCRNPILPAMVAYIRENFANPLSVSEVAGRYSITERYMRRLFTRHLGFAPSEYINRVRIEKATEMLSDCNTNLSIKEVCYRCGFSSPQYFSKVYKQVTGTRPRSVRKPSNE